MPNKIDLDQDEVIKLYREIRSASNVAKLFNCTEPVIRRILKQNNEPILKRWEGRDTSYIIDLYNKYGSIEKVSKETGSNHVFIKKCLNEAGIATNPLIKSFDIELAKELYSQHKNLDIVAKKLGVCRPTLTKNLKAAGVDIKFGGKRSILKGNLTNLEKDLITAAMLGDGYLQLSTGEQTARFVLSSKHKEYLEWYAAQFTSQTIAVNHSWRESERDVISGGHFRGNATSQYSNELGDYKRLWYPDGKKIVPFSLEINPLICLHWYIQDGHLEKTGTNKYIVLSTEGFTKEETEYLVTLLKDFNAQVEKTSYNKHRIVVPGRSVFNFLQYIGGQSPVECFNYKFLYETSYPNKDDVPQAYRDSLPAFGKSEAMGWDGEKCWQRFIREKIAEESGEVVKHNIKDLVVKELVLTVDRQTGKKFITDNEWLGNVGNYKYMYGGFYGDRLAGIVCYGFVGNDCISNIFGEYVPGLVLTRGACVHWAHKHTGSKLVSKTLKMLSRDHNVNVVVAFADTAARELGTIYQACSFQYLGTTAPRNVLYNPITHAVKTSWGRVAKKRGYTYREYTQKLRDEGWEDKVEPGKHKYVKVIGGWRKDGSYSNYERNRLGKIIFSKAKKNPHR